MSVVETLSLRDPTPKVAVIGAGISGLMCARTLADHGCDVTVFEKSRGVAGRMSTRRVDDNLRFDHGAQYFTARDKHFKRYVQSWMDDGLVAPWNGRIVVVKQGVVKAEKSGDTRYIGVPSMNSIGKHIAADLNVQLETQVAAPKRSGDKWILASDNAVELGRFDVVVVAVPSHQAASLLPEESELWERASEVKMNGCWAMMLAFEQSLHLGFDGAFVQHSPISWIARNNSKAQRDSDRETWVVHAEAEWTEAHIDDSPDEIKQCLFDEFWAAVGRARVEPIHLGVHRWRFAIPSESLTDRYLFDDQLRIGACGDWCGGPRVEGAFLSGLAVAGRILG